MKVINGDKAIELLREFVDEDYSRINSREIEDTLANNRSTFDVQVLVSDDEKDFFDFRFFDFYQHLPVPENSCRGILPTGWTHWQLESLEAKEWES